MKERERGREKEEKEDVNNPNSGWCNENREGGVREEERGKSGERVREKEREGGSEEGEGGLTEISFDRHSLTFRRNDFQ